MAKMEWAKLLSPERERPSDPSNPSESFRNAFDKDYERIISSSSVRRLQDKAQVFPLQENDFTRTRLTHSLEVSSIGRSIGKRVGYRLKEQGIMSNEQVTELASLLAVAGLVHDLGNPPFGHYGEDIIREWFRINSERFGVADWIKDYLYFDGNAQTIRILSRLQFLHDRHGMNFSFGTLGTLLKYPWSSDSSMAATEEKIGYFSSEKPLIEKVFNSTGMKNNNCEIFKHPATFLLESADDIAFLFADLEDAVKKGYLPWDENKNKILETADKNEAFTELREKLNKNIKKDEDNKVPSKERPFNEVTDIRVFCQGICIKEISKEFVENHDRIMEGNYKNELIKCDATKAMIKVIRGICKEYAYRNNEVLSLELIGKSVMNSLLDKFIGAIIDEENYLEPRHESGKLYKLISTNFEYVQKLDDESKLIQNKELNRKERVQLVIDFISGMTDSYALNLHKLLLGMRLP